MRYSNPYSYRGFKALTAEKNGAAALLIYSDPAEDGYAKGKVFPDGPWGPETHIQRGAITYDFIVPGDPAHSRMGFRLRRETHPRKRSALAPSYRGHAAVLARCQAATRKYGWPCCAERLARRPSDQVSLHRRSAGSSKSADGQFHAALLCRRSPHPRLRISRRVGAARKPSRRLEYGGVDPSSGTASMLELTRVFGSMLKEGVSPRRTLVFCSWDGEEIALTGSTEWGEQFGDDLRKKLVAYLNVDSSASGPNLDGGAVGSLAPMLVETTYSIADPSGTSLHDAWLKSTTAERKEEKHPQPAKDDNLVNTRIGSGSDHTVFLNFLGRPVITLQFDGPYGVYHSMYDDFYWMNHFGDPGYQYHATMSRLWGVTALRLAQADVLPFDFASYADNIRQFVAEMSKNRDMSQLDLKAVGEEIDKFEAAGKNLDESVAAALASGTPDPKQVDALNHGMMKVERNWLNPDGIPGRPWFKHMLYGARFTYAHLELPGLTEATEKGDWTTARQQAALLQGALSRNTSLLEQLNSSLSGAKPSLHSLQSELENIRRQFHGEMSIYMKNLASGEEIALDSDTTYETFSVIKLAIAAELMHQVESGKFSLSDRIALDAGNERLASGVLYTMDPGLTPTVKDLLTLMIIISDNEATDALGDKVGRANVTTYMHSLGLEKTSIQFSDLDWDRTWLGTLDPTYRNATGDQTVNFPFDKYSEDQVHQAFGHTIYDAGIYFGHSTAAEIGRLLEMMVSGKLVSKQASDLILSIMEKQQVNDRFPVYLRNVRIAHKTGDGQPFIANDAGVIWVNGQPVVLVVFTGHHRGQTAALHDQIARVAALVVRHYGGQLSPEFKQ